MTVNPPNAWLGIAAAGKTYLDVREALARLGLSDDDLARLRDPALQDRDALPDRAGLGAAFAAGLEEVVVIEEKRSFLELLVRDALYNMPTARASSASATSRTGS